MGYAIEESKCAVETSTRSLERDRMGMFQDAEWGLQSHCFADNSLMI